MEVNTAALRAIREAKGLTIRELARRVHLSHTVISRYERGLRCPKVPHAVAIASELGVPFEALFYVRGDANRNQADAA